MSDSDQSRNIELQLLATKMSNLDNKFDTKIASLENAVQSMLVELRAATDSSAIASAGMALRSMRHASDYTFTSPILAPARYMSIEDQWRELKHQNPALFEVWFGLFENGRRAYDTTIEGNLSHLGNPYARLFGFYTEIYAKGAILDIGTGPLGIPSYLSDFPPAAVFGIEPLPQKDTVGSTIIQSLNEFLPWHDSQFDTVVSGTSLDHVFSLDKSLDQVRRVLKPDGAYLIWIASIKGSPAFDENNINVEAIDEYHLFHFDRIWIEPIFEKYFRIVDISIVPQIGFDHVFYCLKPKY